MLKFLAAVLPTILRDVAGLLGAALISYGTWRVYPAAGYIVAGALLLAGAILDARATD